jgi:heptosyltransferase-1
MNIIIFRTDKLGDLIVSSSVIRAIKTSHPHARIMVVASSYNAVAVQGLDEVEAVVIYDKKMPFAEKQHVLRQLRAFAPTHSMVLSPKNDCYFLGALSGAKIRGGLLMEYRLLPRLLSQFLLDQTVFVPRTRKGSHLAKRALTLAKKMDLAIDGTYPYLIAQDERAFNEMSEQLKTRGITDPFVAVHLADKWIEEAWTKEDVLNFLRAVKQRTGMAVVATAGPADKILPAFVGSEVPVFTNLTFQQWVGLFRHAAKIVTPDCGAVHIACALQKPLLALYPPSRFNEAVSEFGPMGTVFKVYALENPAVQTNILINDLQTLA